MKRGPECLKAGVRKTSDESEFGQRRSPQSAPGTEKERIAGKQTGVRQRRELVPVAGVRLPVPIRSDADPELGHSPAVWRRSERGPQQMAPGAGRTAAHRNSDER